LDPDEERFNFRAFVLRPAEESLSVDAAHLCTLAEAKSRLTTTHGLATLHVGRVRNLGLSVRLDPLPHNPAHATIRGIPHLTNDLKAAQDLANALADQSRVVWRRSGGR